MGRLIGGDGWCGRYGRRETVVSPRAGEAPLADSQSHGEGEGEGSCTTR